MIDLVSQKRDDFFETVRMSTYLVAFIVSDYTHISDTTDGSEWEGGVLRLNWSRRDRSVEGTVGIDTFVDAVLQLLRCFFTLSRDNVAWFDIIFVFFVFLNECSVIFNRHTL